MGQRLSSFNPTVQHYSVLKKWWCIGEKGCSPHKCPYKTLPYFAVIYYHSDLNPETICQ